ncbi:MAG: competence protein ComEA [Clostridiaceae bacterium]|jgi:competence protein ComEA|nr:competence protein ComEA [Clostridiaceae bacterium]
MSENIFTKEIKLKSGILILLIATLIISTAVIGFLISRDESEIIISKSGSTDLMNHQVSSTPQVTSTVEPIEDIEKIKVYVVGEVNKPGVVTLIKGQIIEDAIKAAGGSTEKADIENINLAYVLQENVMLKILPKIDPSTITKGTEIENSNSSVSEPTQNQSSDIAFTGMEIKSDSGGAVLSENGQEDASNSMININTATEAQLETLPGVGPSTASKIVVFREKNGNFKKIEDVMNVPGIGESKFANMKDFICVD